ncbi:unnamed protein product, partial [Rhizoctonia solani]
MIDKEILVWIESIDGEIYNEYKEPKPGRKECWIKSKQSQNFRIWPPPGPTSEITHVKLKTIVTAVSVTLAACIAAHCSKESTAPLWRELSQRPVRRSRGMGAYPFVWPYVCIPPAQPAAFKGRVDRGHWKFN